MLRRLAACSRAASAIEYGLLAALIAIAAVSALLGVGANLNTTYGNASTAIHQNAVSTYSQ